jgi:ABC-2 type transport system ATP-binding protein
MEIAIRADGLRKVYPGHKVALDGVALAAYPGETVGLVGVNGAGKTTLVGCLLGLLRPDAGRVTIDGLSPDDLAVKRRIGYMPERPVYEPWMTGRQYLGYQHGLAGLAAGARPADVTAIAGRVGLADEALRRRVATYSKGMLQRLGLAQALLASPRFLFLDEPTSGLDPEGLTRFRDILAELRALGTTIVLSSHNLHEVERSCDRLLFVHHGRVDSVDATAGGVLARVVRITWIATGMPAALDQAGLEALARSAGATLLASAADHGRFQVGNDDAASALLRALVGAGAPVVEAVAEKNRIERLVAARLEGGPA